MTLIVKHDILWDIMLEINVIPTPKTNYSEFIAGSTVYQVQVGSDSGSSTLECKYSEKGACTFLEKCEDALSQPDRSVGMLKPGQKLPQVLFCSAYDRRDFIATVANQKQCNEYKPRFLRTLN